MPGDLQMAIRRGPDEKKPIDLNVFLEQQQFRPTGSSANIMSSSEDMAIYLSPDERQEARERELRIREERIRRENPSWSLGEVAQAAKKKPFREGIYREAMDESRGVLVIYLFDSHYVFRQEPDNTDSKFTELVDKEGHDLNIPVVGYALGFPPIKNSVGGHYVERSDYTLEPEEPELGDLPPDLNETLGS